MGGWRFGPLLTDTQILLRYLTFLYLEKPLGIENSKKSLKILSFVMCGRMIIMYAGYGDVWYVLLVCDGLVEC